MQREDGIALSRIDDGNLKTVGLYTSLRIKSPRIVALDPRQIRLVGYRQKDLLLIELSPQGEVLTERQLFKDHPVINVRPLIIGKTIYLFGTAFVSGKERVKQEIRVLSLSD